MYEQLILEAGAEYLGEQCGTVRFRESPNEPHVDALRALKTAADVEMALKAAREPVVVFEPLEPTE